MSVGINFPGLMVLADVQGVVVSSEGEHRPSTCDLLNQSKATGSGFWAAVLIQITSPLSGSQLKFLTLKRLIRSYLVNSS